jgi:hypothetical protein
MAEHCDVAILRELRKRTDDQLCQRAANLIEFAIWVIQQGRAQPPQPGERRGATPPPQRGQGGMG